ELSDVYGTLVLLIPDQPSGFTPADLEYARESARRFRQLHARLAKARAKKSVKRAKTAPRGKASTAPRKTPGPSKHSARPARK
ncbi:MAG: hypothetical protein ACXW2I_13750, partial [Burkholderiales bacterium]